MGINSGNSVTKGSDFSFTFFSSLNLISAGSFPAPKVLHALEFKSLLISPHPDSYLSDVLKGKNHHLHYFTSFQSPYGKAGVAFVAHCS